MNTAPGYVCKNCGHRELPDPLNLSRSNPFRCKGCGKDYRNSPTNTNNGSTTNRDIGVWGSFQALVQLSKFVPAKARGLIGLIATIITFFYCISKTGSVVGVDLIPIYQYFIPIQYDLPWGTAGIFSVIVGVFTMTFGVGLAVVGGALFIVYYILYGFAYILYGFTYVVDYFGGWG